MKLKPLSAVLRGLERLQHQRDAATEREHAEF